MKTLLNGIQAWAKSKFVLISTFSENNKNIKKDMSNLSSRISATNINIKSIKDDVDSYSEIHRDDIMSLNTIIGSIGSNYDELYSEFNSINKKQEEITNDFSNQLKQKMDNYNPVAGGKFIMNLAASEKSYGDKSFSSGYSSIAEGESSHAEGKYTRAIGVSSHSDGYRTLAVDDNSLVQGRYNLFDTIFTAYQGEWSSDTTYDPNVYVKYNGEFYKNVSNGTSQGIHPGLNLGYLKTWELVNRSIPEYAHVVGNGTAFSNRSNAHTLDWDGNAWYSGDVYVGSTSGVNKDEGSKKLATEEYVNEKLGIIETIADSILEVI